MTWKYYLQCNFSTYHVYKMELILKYHVTYSVYIGSPLLKEIKLFPSSC